MKSPNEVAISVSRYRALLDELEKINSSLALLHEVGIDHDANLARDVVAILVNRISDVLEGGREHLSAADLGGEAE